MLLTSLFLLFVLPYVLAALGIIAIDDILYPFDSDTYIMVLAVLSGISGILYYFFLAVLVSEKDRSSIKWLVMSFIPILLIYYDF